jgi:hypothetical protein
VANIVLTKFPTSNAAETGAGLTNPNNGHADDGSYATGAPGAKNTTLATKYQNFGFDSIPTGVTIVKVQIIEEHKVSTTGSIATCRTYSKVSGSAGTNHDDATEPAADTVKTYDITSERSWTRANLLDGTFEVALAAVQGNSSNAVTMSFDYVKAEVTYTNTPPTVALNSPADASTDSDTTPTLNFTGTDVNGDTIEYNVQVDTVNTFDSNSTPTLVDSADGGTTGQFLQNSAAYTGTGQSFTAINGILTDVKFYLKKVASPTGNAVAKLYSHSGTYGTSSVPGTLLATSDNFDVSTLTTSYVLTTLHFSGANQYTLVAGTQYVVTIEYSVGDSTNYIVVEYSATNIHGGNRSYFVTSGPWAAQSGQDLNFYVYTLVISPLLNKFSTVDSGFTAGHPFASGAAKDFTVQAGDALAAATYYWRVAGIDPSGSNTYGAWSTPTRSFIISSAVFIAQKPYIVKQAVNRSNTY